MEKENKKIYRLDTSVWHVERLSILIGGVFVTAAIILSWVIHPGFIYFALFVGAMLIFFAVTGFCPMAIFIKKVKPNTKTCKEL